MRKSSKSSIVKNDRNTTQIFPRQKAGEGLCCVFIINSINKQY